MISPFFLTTSQYTISISKIWCIKNCAKAQIQSKACFWFIFRWLKFKYTLHTAESTTYQVSVLIRSFTNAISLWCLKIFIRIWYCKSQIVQGIFFTSKFFEKMKSKDVAVCLPPQSRAPRCASHRGVKIEIFMSLWVPLKGQSGEILLGVNNSIM